MRFRWFRKNCHSGLRFLLILGIEASPFAVVTDRQISCKFPVLFSGDFAAVSASREREGIRVGIRQAGVKHRVPVSCRGGFQHHMLTSFEIEIFCHFMCIILYISCDWHIIYKDEGDDFMADTNTTNISIRMDADLKTQADALFAELGMNLSTAFNIFVRQSIREGRIPFDISLNQPNAETIAAMLEAERIAKDPNVKGYTDLDQLFADLKK